MTINQVISQLREIARQHLQINSFGFNDFPEYGKSDSILYPVMWVKQLPSNVDGNNLNLKFRILFADLVHKGDSNKDDVSNDQMLIALDVIAQLKNSQYDWLFEAQSNLEPVFGSQDDEVTGWIIDINLIVATPPNRCQIPFNVSPTPENEQGFVTIFESDGLTEITKVSNNSYYITQANAGGTIDLYLDGILQSTTNSSNLNAEIINVLWT